MRHDALDRMAQDLVVSRGAAPSASLSVAVYQGDGWDHFEGAFGITGLCQQTLATPETLYDLASISKPLLALLVARLVDTGRCEFGSPLVSLMPELKGPAATRTLEQLLSHRAGLMPHVVLAPEAREGAPLMRHALLERAANAMLPEASTPSGVVYSDLGYLLVAAALQAWLRKPLDTILEEELCGRARLNIRAARGWFSRGLKTTDFAATEHVGWRGGEIRGAVHDENAWVLAGHGFAGHAGLFSQARALTELGAMLCSCLRGDPCDLVSQDVLEHLLLRSPNSSRTLGFDTRSRSGPSSLGRHGSPETFGYLGFTGTSFWADPTGMVVVALLTNRVNPTSRNNMLTSLRPLVHDALFEFARAQRAARFFCAREPTPRPSSRAPL